MSPVLGDPLQLLPAVCVMSTCFWSLPNLSIAPRVPHKGLSCNIAFWLSQGVVKPSSPLNRVLARNEEFSKIAVINFFFSSQKTKQLSVGGFCGENFEIYHANQQFNTCLLTYM